MFTTMDPNLDQASALTHEDVDPVAAAWVDVAMDRLASYQRGEAGESQGLDEVEAYLRAAVAAE